MKALKIIGIIATVLGGIVTLVCLIIGIIALISSLTVGSLTKEAKTLVNDTGSVTTGTVILSEDKESSGQTITVVQYSVGSDVYEVTYQFHSSTLPVGKTLDVYYLPEDPSKCVIPSAAKEIKTVSGLGIGLGTFVALICPTAFGIVLLIAGIVMNIIASKKLKQLKSA